MRRAVRMPLVLLGGIVSRENVDRAMAEGFDFVAMGRALIANPDLVNRMRTRPHGALALHALQHLRRRDGPQRRALRALHSLADPTSRPSEGGGGGGRGEISGAVPQAAVLDARNMARCEEEGEPFAAAHPRRLPLALESIG